MAVIKNDKELYEELYDYVVSQLTCDDFEEQLKLAAEKYRRFLHEQRKGT